MFIVNFLVLSTRIFFFNPTCFIHFSASTIDFFPARYDICLGCNDALSANTLSRRKCPLRKALFVHLNTDNTVRPKQTLNYKLFASTRKKLFAIDILH